MTTPEPAGNNGSLRCARPGCGHLYSGQHAPGGGNCLFWDPVTERHCQCWGFQWVSLGATLGPRRRGSS